MMMSSELGVLLSKPVATAVAGTALSRYLTPGFGLQNEVGFGIAAGTGVLIADLASKQIGRHHGVVTRSLEERALELGFSTGAGLLAQRYLVGQDLSNPIQSAGLIVAADVIAEYVVHSFLI